MSSASPAPDSGAILRVLADAISDVVVVLDRDGRYLDIVSRRADLLVRPASELLTKTIHDVFPSEPADMFVRWIRKALDSGRPVEDEYQADIAGKRLWFAAVVTPLTDQTVIWIARDITERKALEGQLRQAVKMEAVGRLAGGVAHDFNNLLTAISTNVELALTSIESDEDVREELGQIRRATERASTLTRQLLAFSRKQMLQPRLLDINAAVNEANELLARLIGEDIQLITCLDEDTWPVVADAGQLTQVVMNLAVNARDAMPNGGTLTITAGNVDVTPTLAARHPGLRPGSYVVLTMRDTGTGMDRGTQERVFEPFFTTKEHGKGTGLGLATVYGIVKQSNGYIQLTSALGEGTTFWIFLPKAPHGTPKPPGMSVVHHSRPVAGMTVLIVEDELQVRSAATRVLRRHGYTVIDCENGLEALAIWEKSGDDIDLVITDVVMPHMGGRELVRTLRRDGATLPVLFISGYAEGVSPAQSDDTGRSVFLAKPFDIAELTRVVSELLHGRSTASKASA